jgi:uncharacterized YccA/Bax inhibitor family protein
MTHDDVIVRTFGLLALLVFTGVATWMFAPVLMFVGFPVAFVLGIIAGRRVAPGPGLCIAFTIFEGMGIGGLSGFFETAYKGIILQAVVATIAVFATVLVLYSFGVIRTSARATRFVVTATIGYMVFCVLNFGLVWFGVLPDFGIRSVTVFGVPLGLVISIVAVLLASYHLMRDFDYVQMGVAARAPRRLAWMCSLCLLATLVWLYLEFLRIFALLRN